MGQIFAFVQCPGRNQVLAAQLAQSFLLCLIQIGYFYCQFPAHVIQQDASNLLPCFWRCGCQCRVTVLPDILCRTEFVQWGIIDLEQTTLLQVGRSNPPAALQIAVNAISQNFS